MNRTIITLTTGFLLMLFFSTSSMADVAADAQTKAPAKVSAAVAPPDVAAPPPDAEKTASGLASKVLQAGKETRRPGPNDAVTVHYSGWTTDGKLFDSSILRGKPSTFPLSRVLAGWTEGLQLMVVGEKRRLWVPEQLAYQGKPDRPQGMLVFDIELLDVISLPDAPADVAAAPGDAETTKSGLASKVLAAGNGSRRPSGSSTVTVHYTGWTTDGKMFDSSLSRGAPATFRLDRVIPGWTEGVQLMVEGEKRRLWVPEQLAYQGKPDRPQGMLVFDIELVSIGD